MSTYTFTVADDDHSADLRWAAVLTAEDGNTAHGTGSTPTAALLAVLHTTAAHAILEPECPHHSSTAVTEDAYSTTWECDRCGTRWVEDHGN